MSQAWIMDLAADITPQLLDRAKADGCVGVIQYAARRTGFPSKILTAQDVALCHARGLSTGLVYQGAGNARTSFSAERGEADGAHAVDHARSLGAPAGSVMYCAVDYPVALGDGERIKDHFGGFQRALNGTGYRFGVYGAGVVLSWARTLDPGAVRWLAGAMGWRGSRVALADGQYELRQHWPEVFAGVQIDRNDLGPGVPVDRVVQALGFWGPETTGHDIQAQASSGLRVSAGISGLNLRQGPGTEHAVLSTLAPGSPVERVPLASAFLDWLQPGDDWVFVCTGDQVGWVAARFVERVPT